MMITSRKFGTLPSGEAVTAYDLTCEAGYKATILSYGATLQSLIFPDGTDIVHGFDDLENYLGNHPYFGAAIGRVANRIGGASFEIDGTRYDLPKNEGPLIAGNPLTRKTPRRLSPDPEPALQRHKSIYLRKH